MFARFGLRKPGSGAHDLLGNQTSVIYGLPIRQHGKEISQGKPANISAALVPGGRISAQPALNIRPATCSGIYLPIQEACH
jgi:hypothetical protein